MSNGLTNGSGPKHQNDMGQSLLDLPKSNVFTRKLPPDPEFPTPASSHKSPRSDLGPRRVKGALYTFVRPEKQKEPELLAVSPAALRDLGIREGEEQTELFREVVSGNRLLGWDEESTSGELYPWAQCYGGWQFGSWADQLGDGRVISIFEVTNPSTKIRYELQLKGAGRTPYSRFADGQAVLRSSIREFIVSEALHALRIPTTRALSLTLLPHNRAIRERVEPCAIVARFAQSWLRIGTFDLLGARRDRVLIRRLADYVAEDVFGGWEKLPGKLPDKTSRQDVMQPPRGVEAATLEGSGPEAENRYARLYREIVRRNAITVAAWQAYGFCNGVLNTDNTSIFGLSMDFGPFAFMDNFDRNYTPNHDDYSLRYSYKNQPTVIWWNLLRLGETIGELIGAGAQVDEKDFMQRDSGSLPPDVVKRAETVVERAGNEYKTVFLTEYKRLMMARLGFREAEGHSSTENRQRLLNDLLEMMEALELDFNHFFRHLSETSINDIAEPDARKWLARRFFRQEDPTPLGFSEEPAREQVADWLGRWRQFILEDLGGVDAGDDHLERDDEERRRRMKAVNPKFIPRNWVLDELIQRVERQHERKVLQRIMHMSLHPFDDHWDFPAEYLDEPSSSEGGDPVSAAKGEAERFCSDVPKRKRAMQCSCSS